MYDWGKSSFETSVVSAIFPTWFAYLFLEANGLNTTIAGITMEGDALIAYLVAFGTWAVAIIAPALGVIADYKPVKMSWLRKLTYVGAGSTFLLGFDFLAGDGNEWIWLLIFYFTANIGLNAAGVFYNALVPHLGKDEEMDSISNRACIWISGRRPTVSSSLGISIGHWGRRGDKILPRFVWSMVVWIRAFNVQIRARTSHGE